MYICTYKNHQLQLTSEVEFQVRWILGLSNTTILCYIVILSNYQYCNIYLITVVISAEQYINLIDNPGA